ncbi:MAG: response regulator [Planctomycetota bacterium]|jgi:signal transduction histidine kinase/ActR/RegA family two-component response regulator|nr:response regulator [Planctomycetota bacterium]
MSDCPPASEVATPPPATDAADATAEIARLTAENKQLALEVKKNNRLLVNRRRTFEIIEQEFDARLGLFEALLKENEQQKRFLTMLMRNSVNLVALLDKNLHLVYASENLLSAFGIVTLDAVAKKSHWDFYQMFADADFAHAMLLAHDEVADTGKPATLNVSLDLRHAGNVRNFTAQIAPMFDRDQHFGGELITLDDNTEIVKAQKAAEDANRAKSHFLASMSHEIRTPMNAIIGLGSLMRTDNFDATQRQYFANIKTSAEGLLQIINDILDFSKIEAGKLTLAPRDFNLRLMFTNVISMLRFAADAKSLTLRQHLADDVPPMIIADETRVRQIVVNIANNAIKYTASGKVEVSLTKAPSADVLVLTVADTGIGIKKENLPRLFGRFQQFDLERNRGVVGTGLGLAITKQLVELMNGDIRVESEYEKGTTVTIRLPFVAVSATLAPATKAMPIVQAPDAKVLVVDDNEINLVVATAFLEQHGIAADTAVSGAESVEKAAAASYDLIFMDQMMPEMDGIEATKLIRALGADYQKTPIIALTANAMSGAKEMFIENGMDDFLAKPFDADELNVILNRYLPAKKIKPET